jgi:hypothetical protein
MSRECIINDKIKDPPSHRFHPPGGWVVGRINSRKQNIGAWEGTYPGDGLFYLHTLEMEDFHRCDDTGQRKAGGGGGGVNNNILSC